MKKIALSLLVGALICGCASSYAPSSIWTSDGFSETQLAPNIFRVDFKGNSLTDVQRVQDFALLRSAELTLNNGFTHFVIVDSKTDLNKQLHTTDVKVDSKVQTYKTGYSVATTTTSGGDVYETTNPSASNMIMMFKTEPVGVFSYSADFLSKSLKKKYQLDGKQN